MPDSSRQFKQTYLRMESMFTAIASPYGEYNYCLRALLHPRTGSTMAGQDISVRRIPLCRSTYVESHKLINIKGHQSTLTVYNTNGIFNIHPLFLILCCFNINPLFFVFLLEVLEHFGNCITNFLFCPIKLILQLCNHYLSPTSFFCLTIYFKIFL